jgi:hypothetical protein
MLIPAEICESSCGQIVDHYSVQNMYYDAVNGFISLSLFMLCIVLMFVHPLFLPFMLQPLTPQQEAKSSVEMVSKSITDKFFNLLPRLVSNTIKTNKGTYLKNRHTKCEMNSPTVARIEAQNT